jgi:hypothetical protein
VNKNGNPKTLVAAHPGNLNAAKHGVHSERRIQPRAAEIFAEFVETFEFSPPERLAVWEVARSTALLEAIDQALDESGLANKRGEAHSLLNHRARISRQLQRWMADISPTIERQSEGEPVDLGQDECVRELERIAAGKDKTASAHGRIAAMRELRKLKAPAEGEPTVSVIRIIREDDGAEQITYEGEVSADYTGDEEVTSA